MSTDFKDAIKTDSLMTDRDNVFSDGGFLAVKAYSHEGIYHDTFCIMNSNLYPSDEDIK